MTIYVDEVRDYPFNAKLPSTRWCHMACDGDIEELHALAQKIGLKRSWFQKGSLPHYDLTEGRRKMAVQNGAVEVTSRELVVKCKPIRSKQ